MKKQLLLSMLVFIALVGAGTAYRAVRASDHDDGENDLKSRALNLTDHYAWKDTADSTKIDFVQASNPRSLQGFQYFFSTMGQYEIHISRVSDKTKAPTGSEDMIFRFTFAPPTTANVQTATFTVINGGNIVGTATGYTTPISASSATMNSVTVGGVDYKFFAGLREDNFYFDVERFFAVRNFLANAFFSGQVATTALATFQAQQTCDGNYFLQGFGSPYDQLSGSLAASSSNGDPVHLFNPPSCAQDFTYHYNRNEIELQAPISALKANNETTFDTWSIINYQQ